MLEYLLIGLLLSGLALATASHRARYWATIEGLPPPISAIPPDTITIEVARSRTDTWQALRQMLVQQNRMWVGGKVERWQNEWGFRFSPESVTVAEVTAEALQTSIRGISEQLDYWLEQGCAYVSARVISLNPNR